MMPVWRSLLFVPADDTIRLAKAATRGADALILDLEDAIPPARKASARDALAQTIPLLAAQGASLVVRINAGWRDAVADLEAAVRPEVAAIMVPKVENVARLVTVGEMVGEFVAARGLAQGPGMIALVESPAGIAALQDIGGAPGLVGMALGSEDFALALGVPPTPESLDLPCRAMALAAARHGMMALGLPVSIATIEDVDAWARGIVAARAVGMTGALCIHPRQIAPVNRGFAPSDTDVAAARRIIEAWDATDGTGVILFEGRMIDLPVVLAARRTVEQAAATD